MADGDDTSGEAPGDGLIHAWLLDGKGAARRVDWDEIRRWQPAQGPVWIHLDRTGPHTEPFLEEHAQLEPVVVAALVAEETRPRSSVAPGGVLIILRGVNLNPGADPEDMVSLRVWLSDHRIVTLRRRPVMAVQDVQERLIAGDGPTTAGELLVALTEHLSEHMGPVIEDLDESLDGLEVEAIEQGSDALRPRLAGLRRQAIALRRHIAPLREALLGAGGLTTTLLNDTDRMHLREVADRITRYVEDLDALRERAAVTHDELGTRVAEIMNRRMYILSIVAAIFLPLGLVTGLLGVNVGGLPGTQNEWGFWIVTALLVLIAAGLVWTFRARKLL